MGADSAGGPSRSSPSHYGGIVTSEAQSYTQFGRYRAAHDHMAPPQNRW